MMSWLDRPGRSTAGVTVNCSPVPVPLAVAVRLLTEDAGTPRLLARVEEFTLVALPSTRADTIALWNAGQHTNAKPCTYVHCKPNPRMQHSLRSTHRHWLSPLHTPQLSTPPPPPLQHTPDGGNRDVQHVPYTSTATPAPLHTPHASTRSGAQHTPTLSAIHNSGQHSPEVTAT
jgi:hypothetical protein